MPGKVGVRRHPATAYSRPTHSGFHPTLGGGVVSPAFSSGALGGVPITGQSYGDARDGEQNQTGDLAPSVVDGTIHIIPGTVPASSFDVVPPALPTGLTLSSDVVLNNDGGSFVRLLIALVQPVDTDLYGSHVEVTSNNDGASNPVWDRPLTVFIPAGSTQSRIDDVQGVTQFWARARASDVLGNRSAFAATVTHTTVGDAVAPPVPNAVSVIAGFRGFAASWSGGDAADLAYYELRYAQAVAAPDATDGAWTVQRVKANVAFVGGLNVLGDIYWVEVRGVDLSGNVSAWSTAVSIRPSLIGSADLGVNSISAAAGHIADLDATDIKVGVLRVNIASSSFADGIHILNGPLDPENLIGRWDDAGLKLWASPGSARYMLLDTTGIIFDDGTGARSAMTADGIDATAITFGTSAGGHNLIPNSSFELAGFLTAAPTTAVFTDNVGTPGWKAANRTIAIVNTTEGAADLRIAAMAY